MSSEIITDDKVRELLSCAFEGGSTYWYANLDASVDNIHPFHEFEDGGEFNDGGVHCHWSSVMPTVDGCGVSLMDKVDDGWHKLSRPQIEDGIVAFMKLGTHVGSVIDDEIDGSTGDAFLQCCIFGSYVYAP